MNSQHSPVDNHYIRIATDSAQSTIQLYSSGFIPSAPPEQYSPTNKQQGIPLFHPITLLDMEQQFLFDTREDTVYQAQLCVELLTPILTAAKNITIDENRCTFDLQGEDRNLNNLHNLVRDSAEAFTRKHKHNLNPDIYHLYYNALIRLKQSLVDALAGSQKRLSQSEAKNPDFPTSPSSLVSFENNPAYAQLEGQQNHYNLFHPYTLQDMQMNCKKHIQSMGESYRNTLEQEILTPLFHYMATLKINRQHVITDNIGSSSPLDTLLEKIERAKALFRKKYQTSLSSSNFTLFNEALERLQEDIKDDIYGSQKVVAAARYASIKTAEDDISKAASKRNRDIFCIFACALWCPIENACTVLNCLTDCCTDDPAVKIKDKPGRYHLFAPYTSIKNACADYSNQKEIMARLKPQAQRML